MYHYGDITKINGAKVPVVDTIIFGAPCQDLSIAGKRAGMKHGDLGDEEATRSGLFMEAVRIIKEMRRRDEFNGRTGVDIRPRYGVYENVPGAFSSNKGDDFRIVLEELAKVADEDAVIPMPDKGKWTTCGCIVGDGWSIAWRVLDAQFWRVPQRRRRIALVADFGGQSAPEILFVRKSVSGDSEPSQSKGKETTSDASRGFGADDCLGVDIYNTAITGDKACPLTAEGHTSTGTCPKVMTPITLKIRSGCEGGGKGALVQNDKSATLATNNDQYLFQPVYSVEKHPNDSRVGINEDGKVQTLSSRMGTGGGNVPMVLALDRATNLFGDDKVGTLMARDFKGVGRVDTFDRVVCQAVDCRNCTDDDINRSLQSNSAHSLNGNNVVRIRYIVRRLTPLECERLQGYPDGWTQIGEVVGYDRQVDEETGEEFVQAIYEYIDDNGKKRKTSDAARYKALGNSIALPPWKWVLKRLCACYERDATMASLFDGIGGFPYLWEQLNGKGSCLWASEIEEFPIAVTKARIGE